MAKKRVLVALLLAVLLVSSGVDIFAGYYGVTTQVHKSGISPQTRRGHLRRSMSLMAMLRLTRTWFFVLSQVRSSNSLPES